MMANGERSRRTCALGLAILTACAAAAAGADAPTKTRAELEGRARGTNGLTPTDKVHCTWPVESPIDFGQLKPGARVPDLPPAYTNAGKEFDLNAALARRPSLVVMWRG